MSFGQLGGPIGRLGVALLLAAASPRARVGGLVLVGLGASLLGAEVAPDAHRMAVALGVAAVVLLSVPVALLLRRWPWILAFAVLPAVPFRVPLVLGGTHAQLELPLYLLAGPAGVQIALEKSKGDRRARELGPLAVPLAAFVLWTGLSILWTNDVRAGSFELLAYFLPVGVIAVGIARAPWGSPALTWLGLELLGLALLFAAVGVYRYATRDLFWNPKVIVGNAYLPFYRVNSMFWDPSIYGRFLMIAIGWGSSSWSAVSRSGVPWPSQWPSRPSGSGFQGKEPKKAASHDTPVTVAAESGLVGLGLFMWVILAAFRMLAATRGDQFLRRVALAVALGLVAITVHSVSYNHFFEDPTTWCLLGLAGLAYAASGEVTFIPVRSATPPRSRGREARRASRAPAPAGRAA